MAAARCLRGSLVVLPAVGGIEAIDGPSLIVLSEGGAGKAHHGQTGGGELGVGEHHCDLVEQVCYYLSVVL